MKTTGWDQRLDVRADDRNLIGHAGVVLLRKIADRVGLTQALAAVLPKGTGPGRRDRGMALVQLACAIVLGATNVLQAEQLHYHWRRLFPCPLSDSTLRRTLETIDGPLAARVERARAVIRRGVWTLLALRPGGFPWILVCARELTGWYVLDLDAIIVTCTSRKEGTAGTFKGSFGHMPLGAWVANTRECVAMLLRPGNAPPNDVADHKSVLAAALRQLPLPLWSKLLVRIDGTAFSHALLDHLQTLTTCRRRVRWVTGWAINTADETAMLPETVWTPALRQDGELHEITGPPLGTLSLALDLPGQYRVTPSPVPRGSSRSGSRRLHAGHRLASRRAPARLVPRPSSRPGFDAVCPRFDTSQTIHSRSPS